MWVWGGDVCVYVYVCVGRGDICVGVWGGGMYCMCVCVGGGEGCMCVCVCVGRGGVCVYVCVGRRDVCVCGEGDVCVYVCMDIHVQYVKSGVGIYKKVCIWGRGHASFL